MRNLPRNEVSTSQSHSIKNESRGKSAFGTGKVALLVLPATILAFLYGTTAGSTTAIINVVQFQTIVSRSGLPADWSLQRYRGTPSFKINQNALPPHLQMTSSGETAFGFQREIYVDIPGIPLSLLVMESDETACRR